MDIKHALVIEDSKSAGVDIGKTVTLKNEQREMTYQVVGDLEANPAEGKISLLSPIGKAIVGKQLGDEIKISTPSGEVTYKIKSIS
jgi:transcription elongation factor GreA